MKKFTKIMAMVLAAVLLVAASVGATVAYLTYEADPVENTFTVGDISIGLDEIVDTEGRAEVTERDTSNGAVAGGDYTNIMPGDKLIKIPTVTNTGVNPAYVALTVTVNNLAKIQEVVKDQATLDQVFTGWDLVYGDLFTVGTATDAKLLKVDEATATAAAEDNWFEYDPAADTIVFTYYLYLENKGDSFTPFEEINVPAAFNRDQLAMFEGLNIKVEAAAIQADNVPTAEYGFMVLNGDELPVLVNSAEELKAALEAGETDVLVKGATFTENFLNGRYYKDRNIEFVDCVFAANMNYMYINDATFTNCVFDCGSANSAVHYDELFGDAVFNNCTFISGKIQIGANAEVTGTVTFNNCEFAQTASTSIWSEAGIRVYSPAEFNGCEFNNRVVLAGAPALAITFNGCTMNGGTPVYYVDNTDGIIRGGNIPTVTIND